ncbi:MAG: Fe-Mn family superoxide dismutase, partial [Bacteroidales bacterium]
MQTFELPPLPFAENALEPYISAQTISFHYGKHHKTYVDNLNKLKAGTDFAEAGLVDIIMNAEGPLFNNAAQVWNHTFYWNCLAPKAGGQPQGDLLDAIIVKFGTFESFQKQFTAAALAAFGSAWVWLVDDAAEGIKIIT